MIKEIQYKGYATEPSDYECADGQLAMSLNLISEDGQLKPVFKPYELAQLPDGFKVVYIHDANAFTHYILQHGDTLYWIDERFITEAVTKPVPSSDITAELALTNPSRVLHTFTNVEIYNENGIGNTLVVSTSEGMHYFLWKGESEGYHYLGTHFPELHISFGLQATVERSDEFDVDGFSVVDNEDLNEEHRDHVTNQVLAKVNKFIAERATQQGRFIYPFFVRYAYRLYDGSLSMHSAPVLMITATKTTPIVDVASRTYHPTGGVIPGENEYTRLNDCRVVGILHKLDYAVLQQSQITALGNWSDIITSVDVFISKPIYTYDQNGKIKDIWDHNVDHMTLCKLANQDASYDSQHQCKYQFSKFGTLCQYAFVRPYATGLAIPGKSTEQIYEEMRTTSQFYFLHSFKISELTTTRTIIEVAGDFLQSLTARELMTDDYDSHDKLIPRYSFAYNSRLNLANLKKSLYNTYNFGALQSFSDGYIYDDDYSSAANLTYQVYFKIKQDGRDIIVQGGSYELSAFAPLFHLYYPNVNAYKAIIKKNDVYYEFPMEAHPMLNGALYFGGWDANVNSGWVDGTNDGWYGIPFTITAPTPSTDAERIIEVPNKIYTSQVNNPFHFPVLGINTVGTGRILGISAAVKAMSQGQFGQFPLYAFTTEGVWALEVSSTGSYSTRQPVTRDVCINANSITQTDDAVLFATDRGIMLIQGSQTACITDQIASKVPFNVLDLPGIDQLHTKLGHTTDACLPIKPFLGFLDGCRMVYDYVHQHIIVFNPKMKTETVESVTVTSPEYTYAYVYSLKSKQWGMMFSELASPINSYPEALAMTHGDKLVSFSITDEDAVCKALYVTRPLKLDAVDIHKTISALIQRGHFERGDVGTVLYGSRDLYNWFLVWSSKDHYLRGFRGTPYKYFRIAGVATLTDGKSIFGASVNAEPRLTNNLR